MEGAPRRSPRVDSLLLQLRKASQGAEIRTRGPDAGHAGGIDHQAADVPEIFSSTMHFLALRNVTFVFFDSALLVDVNHSRLSMTASNTRWRKHRRPRRWGEDLDPGPRRVSMGRDMVD